MHFDLQDKIKMNECSEPSAHQGQRKVSTVKPIQGKGQRPEIPTNPLGKISMIPLLHVE